MHFLRSALRRHQGTSDPVEPAPVADPAYASALIPVREETEGEKHIAYFRQLEADRAKVIEALEASNLFLAAMSRVDALIERAQDCLAECATAMREARGQR